MKSRLSRVITPLGLLLLVVTLPLGCAAAQDEFDVADSDEYASKAPPGGTAPRPVPQLRYDYDYLVHTNPFIVGYLPEDMMCGAGQSFVRTFPFTPTCGSFTTLPPEHSPPYACTLAFAGTANPLAVERRTPTSFTFRSLAGHSEGPNRMIRFTFYERPNGGGTDTRLRVEGWGPWNAAAQGSIASGAVRAMWQTYADTLGREVSNGTLPKCASIGSNFGIATANQHVGGNWTYGVSWPASADWNYRRNMAHGTMRSAKSLAITEAGPLADPENPPEFRVAVMAYADTETAARAILSFNQGSFTEWNDGYEGCESEPLTLPVLPFQLPNTVAGREAIVGAGIFCHH